MDEFRADISFLDACAQRDLRDRYREDGDYDLYRRASLNFIWLVADYAQQNGIRHETAMKQVADFCEARKTGWGMTRA